MFFGLQKFGETKPNFSVIAEKSGISFFEPEARMQTGVAEAVTAIFIVTPHTRLLGARTIGLHLSPWLGINVPGIGHSLISKALGLLALTATLVLFPNNQCYALLSGRNDD